MSRNKSLGMFALRSLAGACLVSLAGLGHAGIVYQESGDAGALLGTAQIVSGGGTIDAIRGRTAANDAADMFAIFLTGGVAFSASTDFDFGYNEFDTVLFLFSSTGVGLAASDDDPSNGPWSLLNYTPTTSGIYYLAISGPSYNPTSAGGNIFPSLLSGGQFGATGPGGASPLTGWAGATSEYGQYEIRLTGATAIPEPATWGLALTALGAAAMRRRRPGAAA